MANYVCDLCGFQSEDRAELLSHLRAEHQVEDAGPVGSLEQDDGLLTRRSGDGVTTIDLDAWLEGQLTGYAAGWDMASILGRLRADGLTGDALLDVSNRIAAELEAAGRPMTPAADVDTVTLTTTHAASSYGMPVLVIEGQAYGPADMTPAGVTGAELVTTWAVLFAGYGRTETRMIELEAILRDLWAGAMIGTDGAGFVKVSPEVTARVVAALR